MARPQLPDQPALTEHIAISAIHDFFHEKPFLVFGTGMSCALDPRFGMAALKDELIQKVVPNPEATGQIAEWACVTRSLQNGADLENALNGVSDPSLLQRITTVTGRFLGALDREYAFKIASGAASWPATRLIKRLVDTLPEGDRILHA